MQKNIIVAVSDNNAIGRNNELLWHLSEDLRFFRRSTTGYPVIMGRKTFESIGRPLPKRVNIVVSRSYKTGEEVAVVPSLEDAFRLAEETSGFLSWAAVRFMHRPFRLSTGWSLRMFILSSKMQTRSSRR